VLLKNMECLALSELQDDFLGVMVPEESDMLLVSTRKTEIVTVLVEATKKNTGRDLDRALQQHVSHKQTTLNGIQKAWVPSHSQMFWLLTAAED